MIAALAMPPFWLAWFLLGQGRSGSLADCFPGMPWLRDLMGGLAMVAFCFAIGLALVSFFGESRWWGLSALVVMTVSAPVVYVLVFALMFGDPGTDSVGRCPIG
jgi:hypothetical protein